MSISACEVWFDSPSVGLWRMPRPPFLHVPLAQPVSRTVV